MPGVADRPRIAGSRQQGNGHVSWRLSARFSPVRGRGDPDDGGELARGMAATAPPDVTHGNTDGKVGFQ